ncbi:hypothetical protein QCA50_007807 [Cerrena zonata]|uniref:DUF6534 domain-containing protein n=1 Tax=Cerrena zonata TaxID=2478898 RepID=A0AAW0GI43_9APHY
MDSVEAPPSLPSLTYFLTPFIQLIACSGILYGTSVLQSYHYMLNCDEDSVRTKLFVAFLFILETMCTAFSFYGLNAYTVGALQNPITLFALDWTVCATPILVNVIQILVSGTRSVITWLLILTVNTGLVLSAVGICTLIAYLKMTDSLAYAGLLILSGKLYANSFLAMLNGRHALRTRFREPVTLNTSVLGLSSLSPSTGAVIQPVQIEFSQETYDSTLDIGTIVNLSKQNEANEMSV